MLPRGRDCNVISSTVGPKQPVSKQALAHVVNKNPSCVLSLKTQQQYFPEEVAWVDFWLFFWCLGFLFHAFSEPFLVVIFTKSFQQRYSVWARINASTLKEGFAKCCYIYATQTTQFYFPNHGTDCRFCIFLEKPFLYPLICMFSILYLSSLSFVIPFVTLSHCLSCTEIYLLYSSSNPLWVIQSNYLVTVVQSLLPGF